jgi:ribokinase
MLRFLETATGSGIGFTDAQGENCLAVYPGANALLSSGEIRSLAECVRQTDLVLAQFEVSDEPILEAFALAQEAGRQTLLNPSPYRSVDPGILQKTSILVLNSTEAEQMSHDLDLNMGKISAGSLDALACVLLTRGPELVIVTLGGNGAAAYPRGKTPFHQAAFPVEVVDTLGAGDAFTAGLAASFLENRSLKESLERAAACGAIVCQRVGVFDALPTANELELFLYAAGSQPQV